MAKTFEDLQQTYKENLERTMKSVGAVSNGAQAIAAEVTGYSKKAFEDGTAALEKLFGAKSFDKALEVQREYVKNAYQDFVSKASKIGELYVDLAKEAYEPFEMSTSQTR